MNPKKLYNQLINFHALRKKIKAMEDSERELRSRYLQVLQEKELAEQTAIARKFALGASVEECERLRNKLQSKESFTAKGVLGDRV